LNEIHKMAGHMIRRLNQISLAVFAERMAREGFDLTPVQFAALTGIEATPGIDQATLAGTIAYDRVTIGGVLDRLEAKGLVRRSVSKRDRRARQLHLTETGQKVLSSVTPIVRDLQGEILAGLDRSERARFLELMEKLIASRSPRSGAMPGSD